MEAAADEPEVEKKEFQCSLANSPQASRFEFLGYAANETSLLSQLNSSLSNLRSQYRQLKRMHPYADEKMKMKVMLSKILTEVDKKNQLKNQKLQQEIITLRNSFESYEKQINCQKFRIKLLEEQITTKDQRIKSLEEDFNSCKIEKDDKVNELDEIIKAHEERVKAQNERIKSLENELNEAKNVNVNEKELMKLQDDRIQLLKKEMVDLNHRVKKQEMQIQFLEVDLKYKDKAESDYSENVQRQDIKIQFLEIELDYRKNKEDALKQEKEKLENKVYELTKSTDTLTCENLSLNNILKEIKSDNRDGCSQNEDFCCETVKQVKLSFIDLIETEFECAVCNGMFIEATITTCNHMFCNYCLHMWRKKSPNCPICRSFIKYEIKTTVIDNYIMSVAKLVSDKMLTDRKKLIEERKQAKSIAKYKRVCV